jgi:hypothetical protein
MHEIDGRIIVGVVGNRADHGKRNAQLKTHLRHRCAFHFHCQ